MKKTFPLWHALIVLVPMCAAFLIAWGSTGERVSANEEAVKEVTVITTEQGKAIARVDERTKLMLEMLKKLAEK